MGKPRQIVRRIHLWLGLGLGAVMVLAGLTGSAIVFYVEIDGWLHPEQASERRATLHSYDQAIQTLRAAYPDKQAQWRLEFQAHLLARQGWLRLNQHQQN